MVVYLSLNSYFQLSIIIVCSPYKNPQYIYLQETAKRCTYVQVYIITMRVCCNYIIILTSLKDLRQYI